jgi:tRNA (mo5U34)-methyltransferase
MLDAARFFGPHSGFDEPRPGEYWHHTVPLPNGRQMRSNGTPNPDAQRLMWNAFELKSLRGKTVLDVGAADGYFSLASEAVGADNVTALDLNY